MSLEAHSLVPGTAFGRFSAWATGLDAIEGLL
jgi:hypothetical protein